MNFFEIDHSALSHEAHLKDDLGLDSLDLVELIMICEKDYMISLPDREWMRAKTVGEMEKLIETYLMQGNYA